LNDTTDAQCVHGSDVCDFDSRVLVPNTLGDAVETSMSTQIEKGAEWFEELLKALDNAACGILCLTPEAMESRWVHFESGLSSERSHSFPRPSRTVDRRDVSSLFCMECKAAP